MKPWTTDEIAFLRESSSLGAATIADTLGRSVASVKAQAHRQGISLLVVSRRVICPSCGRTTEKLLARTGHCLVCKRKQELLAMREERKKVRKLVELDRQIERQTLQELDREKGRIKKQIQRDRQKVTQR